LPFELGAGVREAFADHLGEVEVQGAIAEVLVACDWMQQVA